ncbi:ComEC/Rec2 family competence protein [Sphingobacterium sp.]|uniref:ComEC/Rec2 family competence protein n=1 Tax=Sphingobacterium sp. TaxID=341027 RepID=UPI0028A793A1|nr:ComEC/Rec2 family competence protein [Sphingobacterium sp.]
MKELSFLQRLERVPILKLAAPYVVILLLASRLPMSVQAYQYVQQALVVMTLLTICCYLLKGSARKYGYICGYYVSVVLFGIYQFWRNDPSVVSNHFAHLKADSYVVKIIEEPRVRQNIVRFSVEVVGAYKKGEFVETAGVLMLSLKSNEKNNLQFGDLLWLKGSVRKIAPPLNPMEFDFRKYLRRYYIQHEIFVVDGRYKLISLEGTRGFSLIGLALQTRRYFMAKLRHHLKEDENFAIASALLYGSRSDISAENIQAFTNTGTIHVLSVSGMHVAVLFGFLSLIFKRIAWPPCFGWLPLILLWGIIWMYAFIAGLDPPITRAAIMISFVLCAQHFKRSFSSLNSLVIAAVLILLVEPRAITDVGFQLSFLAVLGMTVCSPLVEDLLPVKKPVLRLLRDTLAVSIAAQVLTTPLSLYYFGQFPTYFLVANLLVDFPSTLIMYLGFVMTINPVQWLNDFFGFLLEHLISFMVCGLKFIDHLAFSTIKIDPMGMGLLFLAYGVIFSFLYAFQWKDKRYVWLGGCCVIGMFLISGQKWLENKASERFRVYNTRRELTIGYFKDGRGIVYSTFDSLQASGLQYACGREIQLLTKEEVQFVALNGRERKNYLVTLPLGKIAILSHAKGSMPHADLVIVRKNLLNGLPLLLKQIRPKLVILDGSNSIEKSKQIQRMLDSLGVQNYLMKDNFAYVWDKENL